MLNSYITQVQRLLHDPKFQFWSQSELTDYINESRNRVAKDSRCLRVNVPSITTFTQGVEQYSIASLQAGLPPPYDSGYQIVDVMGVTVIWGNTRVRLAQLPPTRFDVMFRYWNSMQSRPVCFTKWGQLNIMIGPKPDTSYPADMDLALVPPPLVNDTTPEILAEPFTTPVKYHAAYLAKFREQSIGEANLFMQQYKRQLLTETVAWTQRVIPDPYSK